MSVWTVILIIAVIAAIILGVLYFVGRKMQAKQEDQRAQLDQMAQTVNMLVIDKKRMKIMEAGFPKMVTDNIPKRAKMSKLHHLNLKNVVCVQNLLKKVLNLCVRINFLLLYKNLKCKIPETYHLKVSGIFCCKIFFYFLS